MKTKRFQPLLTCVTACLLSTAFGSAVAHAQDPAVVNSNSVHVKLENDRVRVLDVLLEPGATEQVHSHPAYVIYVLDGGKILSHSADGKEVETVFKAGDVLYREPLTHWAENIGTT